MNKLSHGLAILATINFALSPAIAIEPHLTESLPSQDSILDRINPIEDATDTNYRRCIYIISAGFHWCFSWGS